MISRIALFLLTASIVFAQDPVTWTKNVISDQLKKAKKNVVVDIDLDGDFDVVCTANPEGSGAEIADTANVVLYLNDGTETYAEKIIDYEFRTARGLACGDLDGDGYPDVIVGSQHGDSSLVWYENPVSSYESEWTKTNIAGGAVNNFIVLAVDLDDDGNLDIVDGVGDVVDGGALTGDYIRWLENSGGSSPTFTENDIINYASPSGIAAADFDGDSDLDITGMCWLNKTTDIPQTNEDVRWWAQGSSMAFAVQETVHTAYGGNDAVASDMDGDDDMDILGAGWKAKSIDWWANDGSGSFSSVNTVKTGFTYSRNVAAADMDGDTDMDILACADQADVISWFENNGSQSFTEHQIVANYSYAYFVTAADMDGDGDMDVTATAQNEDGGSGIEGQLAWWESDLAEEKSIASGDPASESFASGKVLIDFQSGFSGGNTSVFYNHNKNSNRSVVGSGIHHIAVSGFYTIVTAASTYDATIEFYYSGISEWSAISDENDLVICYWDPDSGTAGQWELLKSGNQTVTPASDKITVTGVTTELFKYSLFTLGSSTSDNTLPVQLVSFNVKPAKKKVLLSWETASEVNNAGFEILRATGTEPVYQVIASYESDPNLKGLVNSSAGKTYQFTDLNIYSGETYNYKLYDVDISGKHSEIGKVSTAVVPDELTRVSDGQLPEKIALAQNYPNPFNGFTLIEFTVPFNKDMPVQPVSVTIYDMNGRKVREVFNGQVVAGTYLSRWDGRNELGVAVSSGSYIYHLNANGIPRSKRLQYVK